jgi:hypothetical protein
MRQSTSAPISRPSVPHEQQPRDPQRHHGLDAPLHCVFDFGTGVDGIDTQEIVMVAEPSACDQQRRWQHRQE